MAPAWPIAATIGFEARRVGARLVAAADLLHAQTMLLHRLHERRQLGRDLRRIDVGGVGADGRLHAAAGHLDRRLGDLDRGRGSSARCACSSP